MKWGDGAGEMGDNHGGFAVGGNLDYRLYNL